MKLGKVGALALAFPFAAGWTLVLAAQRRASANSAPAYWSGAQSTGALLAGDACPIAVEKELLTVEIPEFPPLGGDEEAFGGYAANVKAQYTFRNPTASDYTATLFFPFGKVPDYAPETCDFYDETARYTVTENGETVQVKSRHSYEGFAYDGSFDVEEGIGLLTGDAEECFFAAETPVTEHKFHVTVPDAQTGGHTNFLTLGIFLKADPAKTRIAASASSSGFIEKGLSVVTYGFAQTRGDFDFSLYVFGDDVTIKKQNVYDDRAEGVLFEGAAVEETGTTTGTFGAFAAERYPGEESGMTETDWFCGFRKAMGESVYNDMICNCVPNEICAADFMRWYEYQLRFPAGETVVNEVTAPIYPAVRGSGANRRYDYTYLLSPARKWASFGSLRVEINTPYYLEESSLDFEKTEGGYALDWEDGLPLGELTFTLTSSSAATVGGFRPYRGGVDAFSLALVILLAVVAVAVTATTLGIVAARRKKEAAEKRGAGTEGKIDLPEDREKKQ